MSFMWLKLITFFVGSVVAQVRINLPKSRIVWSSPRKSITSKQRFKWLKNALTTVDDIKPKEEFISDYYVGFGRRFEGVPIIGSRIVIRLNGNGDIAMVQKIWRQLVEVSLEKSIISDSPIEELIIKDPMFYERYGKEPISPEDITIIDKKCGYMEAPVNYQQEELRPGCSVSFRIGKSIDETYPQMILSLEDNGNIQKLWGRRYQGKRQQ
jgi:hypothetical protein